MTEKKIHFLAYLLLQVLPWTSFAGTVAESPKPNIVLIVADDLGYTDLGCYGSEIATPNLDQLAREGVRMTQFYNQAVCALSRVSYLTGLYPRFNGGNLLKPEMYTLAELLQTAGYATILSGKWHLGDGSNSPLKRGFEEFYGFMTGAVEYFNPLRKDPPFVNHSSPESFFVHNNNPVTVLPDPYYLTDAITDHALQQIDLNANKQKPFFLHLAFNAPHYPLQARAEDIARYRNHYSEGYEVLRNRRYQGAIQKMVIRQDWNLPAPDAKTSDFKYDLGIVPWKQLHPQQQQQEAAKMEVYAAMVDRMDWNIGRVLTKLKERKIDKHTLVIFFSDNGACASINTEPAEIAMYQQYNDGKVPGSSDSYLFAGPGWATAQSAPFRRYKVWTYEGGISTPMLLRWPGNLAAGTLNHSPANIVDLVPSLLSVAGAVYPDHNSQGRPTLPLEGIDLFSTINHPGKYRRREMGWFLYGNRAYRQGKWKIVWGCNSRKWELYNMNRDRTETLDLSAQHPDITKKLTAAWEQWAVRSQVPPEGSDWIQRGSRIERKPGMPGQENPR